MQKVIELIGRNKNTVISVLSLMVVSLSTIFLFWDDSITTSQTSSIFHHRSSTNNQSPNSWESAIEDIEEGQSYFVLNSDAKFISIQEETLTDWGYTEEDILNHEFFPYIHPADLPELTISMLKALQKGETIQNVGPYRIKTKSSTYRKVIATIIPITDTNGKVTELVTIHKDITNQ